jgi:DNA-directed RNA polymerase I and III subunit RPAC2
MSAETFQFHDEDHTLGNALRWVLAKNPEVEFVGYTMPHPSEPLMNVRLQTYTKSAEEVLDEGLESLVLIAEDLQKKWLKAVSKAQL